MLDIIDKQRLFVEGKMHEKKYIQLSHQPYMEVRKAVGRDSPISEQRNVKRKEI